MIGEIISDINFGFKSRMSDLPFWGFGGNGLAGLGGHAAKTGRFVLFFTLG
jgi:hypothetical protein